MDIANLNPETFPKAATLQKWSRILDVSYSTIHKYYKRGILRGERKVDRSIIVPKSEIIRWLGI